MNAHVRHTGEVAVGHLADQPWFEATIVRFLRLWGDGPDGQSRMQYECLSLAGPEHGPCLIAAWSEMITLLATYRRRPLMRHSTDCPCIGADEAFFALFLATAVEGEAEDALMTALLLVRADVAHVVTDFARQVGLSLKQAHMRSGYVAGQQGQRLH